jgi:hypothetical protein
MTGLHYKIVHMDAEVDALTVAVDLENQVDSMIYKHYDLNPEEIALLEENIPDFAKYNTYPTEEGSED